MMLRLGAVAMVGVMLVASPREAGAMCATPMWIGSEPGTALPSRGVLFVYSGQLEWRASEHQPLVDLSWVGASPVSSTVTRVSDSVARIDYDAGAATHLAVTLYGEHQFPFDARWQAPVQPPRVTRYWHHESRWTCSSTDSVTLELDQPTAALRVRWTFGGATREWIIPGQGSQLELGKIDCGGTTIPPEELHAGGQLELIAIRSDGSEVRVEGLPRRLVTSAMETTGTGLDRDAFAVAEPPRWSDVPHDLDEPDDDACHDALIVGLLLALGILAVLQRRASLDVER